MKTTTVTISLLLFSTFAIGQTISFSYDDSGNRVLRELNLPKSTIDSNSISQDNDELPILESLDGSTISIYPNPTKGILKLEITKSEEKCIALILADLNGKVFLKKETSEQSVKIDISDKPSGTYILRIKSGEEYTEWKIIKQ